MEQRPLTQEEPPDAGWWGGGTPPSHNPTSPPHPYFVKTKKNIFYEDSRKAKEEFQDG